MAYTGHGHQIPGTTVDERKPLSVARCGGPAMCVRCRSEASFFAVTELFRTARTAREEKAVYAPPLMNDPQNYQSRAMKIVRDHIDHKNKTNGSEPQPYEVYIRSFEKVLQNWRALVCTDQPDKMMYEVNYNGDRRETYITEYRELASITIPDQE